ncbi:hypothetical protein AB0N87_18100 [Streptomyces sp. NPDC093228]|uniref:hypothetical protein n=1 Tax=Streptomyces sp. NPDC093228 TaxID=3155070 RepID=UPI0034142A17
MTQLTGQRAVRGAALLADPPPDQGTSLARRERGMPGPEGLPPVAGSTDGTVARAHRAFGVTDRMTVVAVCAVGRSAPDGAAGLRGRAVPPSLREAARETAVAAALAHGAAPRGSGAPSRKAVATARCTCEHRAR